MYECCVGDSESGPSIAHLLTRMGLQAKSVGGSQVVVKVPPTRHDIIHEVDIFEDAAIAFGYNNIIKTIPKTSTIGKQVCSQLQTDK